MRVFKDGEQIGDSQSGGPGPAPTLREALVRLAAAADTLLNVDPHNLTDTRPCATCDAMRGALAEASDVLRGPVSGTAPSEPSSHVIERLTAMLHEWERFDNDDPGALAAFLVHEKNVSVP